MSIPRRAARARTAAGLALLLMTGPAAAAPSLLRPYGTVDVFLPGNAGKGLQDDAQSAANQFSGPGISSSWSVATKSAAGFRAGVQAPVTEYLDVGLSAGYIWGPNSDAGVTLAGPGGSATLRDQRHVQFFRALVEPTLNAPLGNNFAFHLGTGVGVAVGNVQDDGACAGNACSAVPSANFQSFSSNWTGLTWEASPYVTMGSAMLGFRYAGFPTFKGNSNQDKMPWNTFGFFAGALF
jgi:hypothetical protein